MIESKIDELDRDELITILSRYQIDFNYLADIDSLRQTLKNAYQKGLVTAKDIEWM